MTTILTRLSIGKVTGLIAIGFFAFLFILTLDETPMPSDSRFSSLETKRTDIYYELFLIMKAFSLSEWVSGAKVGLLRKLKSDGMLDDSQFFVLVLYGGLFALASYCLLFLALVSGARSALTRLLPLLLGFSVLAIISNAFMVFPTALLAAVYLPSVQACRAHSSGIRRR
jgi:hypothetical protein